MYLQDLVMNRNGGHGVKLLVPRAGKFVVESLKVV